MNASPGVSVSGGHATALLAAAVFFLLLRLLGWLNAPELENHDSVSYLAWAEVVRSGDWRANAALDPDAAPLIPVLTALLSFVTGDMETAARLLSIIASLATFAAVYLLGRRLDTPGSGLFAALLLAVIPQFMRLSYSVLTEPVYIALFSWITLVFITNVDRPSLRSGASLGLLCGLAFLTRMEAILLMAALPLVQVVYLLLRGNREALLPAVRGSALLVLIMALLAAPQVLRVSAIMDTFALNGRSTWTLILSNPDGRSYDEKLWGLDYHPHVMNLDWLQSHPSALDDIVRDAGPLRLVREYAVTVVRNLRHMHDVQLTRLVGLPVLAFSVIGFLALIRSGRGAHAGLLVAFLGIALIAPLLYQVTLRHLLIVVPLLCLLAAPGIIEAADRLASGVTGRDSAPWPARIALLVLAWLLPLAQSLSYLVERDDYSPEYDAEALREPVELVRSLAGSADAPPVVISRKSYLAHMAGAEAELIPYTDLAGLLEYADAHHVDLLFYEEIHAGDYPFASAIGTAEWNAHFREVWSGASGPRQALYVMRNDPAR